MKQLPETEFLWSWRLEAGYLYETDEEIDTLEEYFNREIKAWRAQSWQRWTGEDWKRAFETPVLERTPGMLDAATVKQRCDFKRLIQHAGITLKRVKEGEYKILCPFHNEKTPSCSVSTVKNKFYCFGCNAKGSVLDFIMLLEGCEFIDALRVADHFKQ